MLNDEVVKEIANNLINSFKNNLICIEKAKLFAERAEKKALEINVPVVITILDEGGNLILQHRMDSAPIGSISVSYSKAYTAISFKMTTEYISKMALPGNSFYGLESVDGGKFCIIGGGIPIKKNNRIIGAIGISGGSVEEDISIAEFAIK